jgi:hypothetical protein
MKEFLNSMQLREILVKIQAAIEEIVREPHDGNAHVCRKLKVKEEEYKKLYHDACMREQEARRDKKWDWVDLL